MVLAATAHSLMTSLAVHIIESRTPDGFGTTPAPMRKISRKRVACTCTEQRNPGPGMMKTEKIKTGIIRSACAKVRVYDNHRLCPSISSSRRPGGGKDDHAKREESDTTYGEMSLSTDVLEDLHCLLDTYSENLQEKLLLLAVAAHSLMTAQDIEYFESLLPCGHRIQFINNEA
ncbi:hypothetical protein XZ90_001555 [Salmonella enterica subsp. enterica]|uniref:Uncharacterized protein n=1 Tax=Citrobacter braakii TaxID=57706 RepID=A0A1V8NU75_CITBR|nr:hypothetical protein [Citrobacter braakii]EBW7149042.1 hypothetical protein [Salmonella enterica subsp. enterica serovar Coeln]EDV0068865.1 hypothetical protein [Salmonella enterica subsp. enterica serovar Litchfield]EDV1958053.1 hypothetical protein [Salmonella enterica subsp. enterica serovar Litchfield]OQM39964.1 hypothetical protein BZK42_22205 [Citrobacter braakii]QXC16587.1 hypothetical protein I6L51_00070 [Citrobacter braakii]